MKLNNCHIFRNNPFFLCLVPILANREAARRVVPVRGGVRPSDGLDQGHGGGHEGRRRPQVDPGGEKHAARETGGGWGGVTVLEIQCITPTRFVSV